MVKSLQDTVALPNGVKMPWLGLGVFKVSDGKEAVESVKAAINNGYISIDTAAVYKNEEGVGQGIKESGVSRDKLFITSKVWNGDQGYDSTLAAYQASLDKLGLDYLDLYLIHWPVPSQGKFIETWKAMEKLYKEGKVRAIGVSNFKEHHIDVLLDDAEITPMINQVEFHPHFAQKELRAYCKKHSIQVEAWSPLKQGELLDDPTLTKIGDKYGKSPAQVIIRWDLQSGVVTIPKSTKEHRIIANADVFDFELTAEDMAAIDQMDTGIRAFGDPDKKK
ncbi:aldo/keto reductase [Sediminibacillus albus]|uniref:Aldo/keto reductase n=1 Tax=Sediminibacillus albus TaxID=407036 RepID=A0A1G8Y3L1_9BACI|nr:aldo/keto reductase [Sediminibacillus albus]SDJ97024.1 Aldo/keto reductase [Sediminibacillus albus]